MAGVLTESTKKRAWCVRCTDAFDDEGPGQQCPFCKEPICGCPECAAVHAGKPLTLDIPPCPNLPTFLSRER